MVWKKTIFAAVLLTSTATTAQAAPVIVNFGGTYDANQPLAGTAFTGSFAYDDATTPFSTGSFFGDGTTQNRDYRDFLTSSFKIINNLGTFTSAPSDTRLLISYGPYAGSSTSTTFDLQGNLSFGDYMQFYLTTNNNPTFAANGLPKASEFVLAPFNGSAPYTGASAIAGSNGGIVTSLSATAAATPAVPEPATWAMMIGGMGLTGAAMRRRRRQATVRFA